MNKESLKEELQPYYQKGDCCSWIVELRKECSEKDKEIERLNNILDKLDNKLCSTWQLYYDHSRLTTFKCEDMLYLIEQIRKDIEKSKEGK